MKETHFAAKTANATACKASPEFVTTTSMWIRVNCVDCRNRKPKPVKL